MRTRHLSNCELIHSACLDRWNTVISFASQRVGSENRISTRKRGFGEDFSRIDSAGNPDSKAQQMIRRFILPSFQLCITVSLLLVSTCVLFHGSAMAQEVTADANQAVVDEEVEDKPAIMEFIAPKTFEMLVGLKLTSGNGSMQSTIATTVFPTPWPEQKVEVVEINIPRIFRHDLRELPGGNQQLILFAPIVPANSTFEATVKVRIEKCHTIGPADVSDLVVPKRLSTELKGYLKDSPYIGASKSGAVKKVVREIAETEFENDWERIEAYYDWVRENIRYEGGEIKTVRDAMRDRTGDCEELTSTFIALCRVGRVPARCVWIPNHCYPEFYMEDSEGNGNWFPCQVAGTRNFGSMPEYLPILQKGDRFKVPEKKELQRYIADYLSAKKVNGRQKPKVEFVRQLLGDAANIAAPDLDGAANL